MRFKHFDLAQHKPHLAINPVIVKELRSRMRGARAFVILTGALLLLGTVSYALYRLVRATSQYYYTGSPLSPQIGQTLFVALAFLELMMICFITPAVTAGAVSGEREKLTYEMLLATPLRPASILWGKLVSALSYVFLLVFAAVPLASLVFIFGGVSPRDMIKALALLMTVMVMLGVVGVFMSAWLGRTARATVVSYLFVLALLIGPLFIYVLVGVVRQAEPPRWLLVPNPVSALFSALTPSMPGDGPASVFWALGMLLGGDLRVITGFGGGAGIPRPLYHYTLPLYGVTTLVLYMLATRLVRPTRRWRIGWKEILGALALFLLLGGVVALAFVATADRYESVSFAATATPVPAPIFNPAPVIVERVVEVHPPMADPPLPTPTPVPLLAEADQVAIYAFVVRQLCAACLALETSDSLTIYLQPNTQDGTASPMAPFAESRPLSESLQAATAESLSDLPAALSWEAPSRGDIILVTLGNIHPQEDGLVVVSATLYDGLYADGPGTVGFVFVLEQADGVWQIVEEDDG